MSDIVLPEQGVTEHRTSVRHVALLLQGAPKVSDAAATLASRIGRGLRIDLADHAGHAAELTLRWRAQQHLSPRSPALLPPLLLSGPGGRLWLAEGARFLRALTGIDMDAVALVDGAYPSWFVAAVAGRLAATPFTDISDIVPAEDFTEPDACTLQLSLRQDHHVVTLQACAAAATWLHFLDDVVATPLRSPLAGFLDSAVSMTVPLARHRLPLSAWQGLQAGDIILPASPYFDATGTGTVHLASQAWQVRYLAPGNLQLIALENFVDMQQTDDNANFGQDHDVAEDSRVPGAAEAADDVDEDVGADGVDDAQLDTVSLTLTFELGRIGLPLAEIRTLAPHGILKLQEGGPRAIAIVCGGRTVGRGEAVNVDGALGIRIVQWGGAC